MASCSCNDIHREAARLAIDVQGVEVVASAEFNGVGLAASNVTYQARVRARALIESARFERSITVLLIANAMTLGIDTAPPACVSLLS